MPTPRLVEIAYFLIQREMLADIGEKQMVDARDRARSNLDNTLAMIGTNDETGLPEWVVQMGIGAADGSSPFDN